MRTWKQLICGLLGTTLCAGLLGAVPAAAAMTTENATEDDSGISVDTSGDAAYDVFTYRENDTGVTITSCDTSATPLSEDVQITFLLAAFSGSTSAASCSLCCQFSSNACLFNFTAVTAVSGSATLFVNALILKFVLLVFP